MSIEIDLRLTCFLCPPFPFQLNFGCKKKEFWIFWPCTFFNFFFFRNTKKRRILANFAGVLFAVNSIPGEGAFPNLQFKIYSSFVFWLILLDRMICSKLTTIFPVIFFTTPHNLVSQTPTLHAHTRTRVHTHAHPHPHARTHARTHTRTHAHMHKQTHTLTSTHRHRHIYRYRCRQIQTQKQTHTHREREKKGNIPNQS